MKLFTHTNNLKDLGKDAVNQAEQQSIINWTRGLTWLLHFSFSVFHFSITKIKVLDASGPPGLPSLLGGASEMEVSTAISALSFSPDGEVSHLSIHCIKVQLSYGKVLPFKLGFMVIL